MASSGDATFLMQSNLGVAAIPSVGDDYEMMFVNVGFNLIPTTTVISPQIGWGVPMIPQADVMLVEESSNPTVSMFENVTT